MARAGLFLFAAGGTLGTLLAALPHSDDLDVAGVLTASAAAYAVAGVLAIGFDRLPRLSFHFVLAAGTTITSYGIYFAGASTSAGPMFYLLVAIYAFYFFGWAEAAAHMAALGSGYALVIELRDAAFPVADWLVTMGILVAAGALVRLLRERAEGLVRELRAQAAESNEQARALRESEETLRAHNAVTRVLADSDTLDDAAPKVLDVLGRALGWEWAAFWPLDPSTDTLTCAASWQDPSLELPVFRELSERLALAPGEGLPGRALASREVSWIEDVTRDPNFPRAQAAAKTGVRGAVALPLMGGSEAVGVMELLSREPRQPDQRVVEMLSAIGSQLGQFIERKRAEQQVREHVENIAAVADATRELSRSTDANSARPALCAAAHRVSGAALAVLLEPDVKRGALVATACSEPALAGTAVPFAGEPSGAVRAFVSAEPFFVADAEGHPAVSQRMVERTGAASVFSQPVVRDGQAIAVLLVAWTKRVPSVPQRVAAMMELLADEAVVAVERADLLTRLESVARTDKLTGLANRRAWEDELERELVRAARHQTAVCVAMLDLDWFKAFNDEHGHQAGDRLLKQAAAVWRTELRTTDFMARYGGEEFSVVLPDCDLAGAVAIVKRLCAGVPGDQTCSAGVAAWDGSETPEALLGRADVSLYEAKRAGRDQVVAAA
jgi:diguanylate cyclase (GGDEF)-like protein